MGAHPIRVAFQTGYARGWSLLRSTGGNLNAWQTASIILRGASAYVLLSDSFAILAPCSRWCQAISIGSALPWRGLAFGEAELSVRLSGLALRPLTLRSASFIRCVIHLTVVPRLRQR